MESERFSIRDSARSLKKYGSTCNHVRNNTKDTLIRHDVVSGDTLQGIALKYECTTEQLRRANRLYASDSLFSKLHLMVPVSKGSPYYPAEGSAGLDAQRPHSMPEQQQQNQQRVSAEDFCYPGGAWDPLQAVSGPSSSFSLDFPSTSSADSLATATVAPAVPVASGRPEELSPDEEQKRHLDELLGKIDSTIANSRRFVAKSKDFVDESPSGDFVDDPHMMDYEGAYQNATTNSGRGGFSGSTTTSHVRNASGSSLTTDDTSGLITNSRRVKSSLQRLERTQDELFEL